MSDNSFEAMLRRQDPAVWEALQRARAEKDAAAREAARVAVRRARCESSIKSVEAYNNGTDGTPPEHIFGPRGGALCRGFIDQMIELNFPGIIQLRVPPERRNGGLKNYQHHGYFLGKLVIPKGSRDDFTPSADTKWAVLCADSRLRTAVTRQSSHDLAGNYPRFVDGDDQVKWLSVAMTTWVNEQKWVPGGGGYWTSSWSIPDVDVDGARGLGGSWSGGGGARVYVEKYPGHWETGQRVEVPATLEQRLADLVKYLPR